MTVPTALDARDVGHDIIREVVCKSSWSRESCERIVYNESINVSRRLKDVNVINWFS